MIKIFDKEDFGLLESIASKFRILTETEEKTLNKYRAIGLDHIDFRMTEHNGKFKTTAGLTSEGAKTFHRQKFLSNPIRKGVYDVVSIFAPPYRLNL